MRISEWRIQPAGTRRGGGPGVLARTDRRSGSRTGREPVSSGFLEGSGARGPARARRGLTSLNFSPLYQPWQPFRELGRDFSGGPGRLKKNVKRFPNRTASGDFSPRPVFSPRGTAAHLEEKSSRRTQGTSLHIAAAHTAHESIARTPHILLPRSPRIPLPPPPPLCLPLCRFLGSSVPLPLLYSN